MTVEQHTIETGFDRTSSRASAVGRARPWLGRLHAIRSTLDRFAIRGQLGPSVGHRDDHRPERMI